MEKKRLLVTDELIITGIRHGDLADRLMPLISKEGTVDLNEVLKLTGDEDLYLTKIPNIQDRHAIGVFTATTKKRIGYLWTYQAYSMREWMAEHQEHCVRIRITSFNAKYGFMIAKPCNGMKLSIHPRQSLYMDYDWADNLPQKLICWIDGWLELSMMVLDDALDECETWNDILKAKIDNVVNELSCVLSSLGDMKGIELYLKMKESAIKEVRAESGRVLYAMIHRGSPERMEWWMKHCLPNYFKDAKEQNLLSLFESANFTLEKVEALLHQAPEHLYHVYLGDRGNFAKRLYYSGLPHDLFVRLMTLLSVREAVLEKIGKKEGESQAPASESDNIPSAAEMAAACEQTLAEGLWWGDASWGTAYQVFYQKGHKINIEQFVEEEKDWPWKKPFPKKCNKFSVGNPARRGAITWPLAKWKEKGAQKREIVLGNRLDEILVK